MHLLRTDLRTGIIEVDVIGFWTIENVETYHHDLSIEARKFAAVGKRHMLLVDYSHSAIQSQAVLAAMVALAHDIARPARRVAAYSTGKMAKMQAKRMADACETIRLFDTREQALAWLNEGSSTPCVTATYHRESHVAAM